MNVLRPKTKVITFTPGRERRLKSFKSGNIVQELGQFMLPIHHFKYIFEISESGAIVILVTRGQLLPQSSPKGH